MERIRIGNDIKIVWTLSDAVGGDASVYASRGWLRVEVCASELPEDLSNAAGTSPYAVRRVTVGNGGISQDGYSEQRAKCARVAPVVLDYEVVDGAIVAWWPASKQYAVGDYDIVLRWRGGELGAGCCDVTRFVRLVAHSAQASLLADDDGVVSCSVLQSVSLETGGLSAYDIAVKYGYEGTIEEWAAALQTASDAGTSIATLEESVSALSDSLSTLSDSLSAASSAYTISLDDFNAFPSDTSAALQAMNGSLCSRWSIVSNYVIGIVDIISDYSAHTIVEVLKTQHKIEDELLTAGEHEDGVVCTYMRVYKTTDNGTLSELSAGEWSSWVLVESVDVGSGTSETTESLAASYSELATSYAALASRVETLEDTEILTADEIEASYSLDE